MMLNIHFLNSKENKEILEMLKDQFGIEEKLPYVFLINAKERIFLVKREVGDINFNEFRIDTLGMYFGEKYKSQIRLSIEGCQLIGKSAKRGIIDLNEDQMLAWMRGQDITMDITADLQGKFVIVQYQDDILGCGKWRDGILYNYVSKSRTLKVVNF